MFCQSETDLPFEPESATPYRFLSERQSVSARHPSDILLFGFRSIYTNIKVVGNDEVITGEIA